MSLSTTFTDLEADIASVCSKHEQDSRKNPGYSRAFPFQGYFIKFGPHSTFSSEVGNAAQVFSHGIGVGSR